MKTRTPHKETKNTDEGGFSIASQIIKAKDSIILFLALILVTTNSFFFFIFSVGATYLCHKGFYKNESNILKQLFADQFSDLTSLTLISSPILTYIMIFLQILIFIFPNSEVYSAFTITSLTLIYRLKCFLEIYSLNTIKDFEASEDLTESTNVKNVHKMKNPLPKAKTHIDDFSPFTTTTNNKMTKSTMNYEKDPYYNTEEKDDDSSENEYKTTKFTQAKKQKSNLVLLKNSFNLQYITQKMLCSCLVVISFDFLFLFLFALPLSYGVSLLRMKGGFLMFLLQNVISISFGIGESFGFQQFEKTPIFHPIFKGKTRIGLCIGIFFSVISSIAIKILLINFIDSLKFGFRSFIVVVAMMIGNSFTGELFHQFLLRCGESDGSDSDKKDNTGKKDLMMDFFILQLHKIAMGLPLCHFFAAKFSA